MIGFNRWRRTIKRKSPPSLVLWIGKGLKLYSKCMYSATGMVFFDFMDYSSLAASIQ